VFRPRVCGWSKQEDNPRNRHTISCDSHDSVARPLSESLTGRLTLIG